LKETSGTVFDEVFLYRLLTPTGGSNTEATR
jgi:hypothetical protein